MREAIRADWPLEAVFVGDGVELDVPGVKTVSVASGVLERVATTVTPRPVVAVGRQRVVAVEDLREATFLVVLDSISDPGNLGTIIRAAESAGADGVVVGGGVDVFNPKCVRATAGALFFTRLAVVPQAASALAVVGEWGMGRVGTSASAPRRYDERGSDGTGRRGARQRGAWARRRRRQRGRPDGLDPDRGSFRVVERGERGGCPLLRGRPSATSLVNPVRRRAALCFTFAR